MREYQILGFQLVVICSKYAPYDKENVFGAMKGSKKAARDRSAKHRGSKIYSLLDGHLCMCRSFARSFVINIQKARKGKSYARASRV